MPAVAEALAEGPAERWSAPSRPMRLVQSEVVPEIAARPPAAAAGSLHVLTCGSVDDGKSTLIGRMLWDADALTIASIGAHELRLPRTAAEPGATVRLRVDPRDVILALEPPRAISIRNCLPATIRAVERSTDGQVLVRLDVAGPKHPRVRSSRHRPRPAPTWRQRSSRSAKAVRPSVSRCEHLERSSPWQSCWSVGCTVGPARRTWFALRDDLVARPLYRRPAARRPTAPRC